MPACLPVPCHSKYRQMSALALHPLARQLREIVWKRCLTTNLREGEGLTVSLRQGHAVACFACDDLDESEQAPRFATSLSNGEGSPSLTHGVVPLPTHMQALLMNAVIAIITACTSASSSFTEYNLMILCLSMISFFHMDE